ncbi:MAG: DUF3135 domain-containing protein [Burkholderiales bacterium]|nr:DUF3135 domain-containing protein [Burkholderiales bacterium]
MEFDWDAWSELARSDPAAFEEKRKQAVAALIAAAPEKHRQRLTGLQSRIDLERQRSSSALGACIRISNLMWESFAELQRALDVLTDTLQPGVRPVPALRPATNAQILPFPPRR